ncbi:hypothetical protein ACJX0J_039685, partial [Zea mays]
MVLMSPFRPSPSSFPVGFAGRFRIDGISRVKRLTRVVAEEDEGHPLLPSSSCGREWMIFHIPIGLSLVLEFKLGGVKMENVVSYRWISQLIALLIYAVLLMPSFIKVGYYYFFSRHVIRSVIYGEQPRNRLDLYIPKGNSKSSSVVAFVTGGAWIIGNFPQGTISDMVSDASEAISFICNNVVSFGGDPNKIYLMGQSAGAHIAACALLEQAIKESKGENTYWDVAQMKAYFGLSGGTIYRTNIDKKVTEADLKLFFESICGE